MTDSFDSIEDAIAALQRGEVIIVVDAEDRENEGDFVCAAAKTDADVINLMITHGRGQTCVPILPELADEMAADKGAEDITPNLRRELQRQERRDAWKNLRRPLVLTGMGLIIIVLLSCLGLAGNEILQGRASAARTVTW